jgi:hypothetical protein
MAEDTTRSGIKSQTAKFKALAKESAADQDETAFKKRLEKIAKPPRAPKASKR